MKKMLLLVTLISSTAMGQIIPGSVGFWGTPNPAGLPQSCFVNYGSFSYGAYAWCLGTAQCNPLTANLGRALNGYGPSLNVSAQSVTFCSTAVILKATGTQGWQGINASSSVSFVSPKGYGAGGTVFNMNDSCYNPAPIQSGAQTAPCPNFF